jgi:isopenicillin N synthase-like dioxygenase
MTAPPRIAASLRAERLPLDQEEGDLKEGYRIGNDLAPRPPPGPQGVPFHGPNQWAGSPRPW